MTIVDEMLDAKNLKVMRELGASIFEIAHVTTFKGFRETTDGKKHPVTVEVHDSGPHQAGGRRYSLVVSDNETGKTVSGNARETLDSAIIGTHWNDLDK